MDNKHNLNNGLFDSTQSFFKRNMDLFKGMASFLLGSYLVFLKYQIIVDFGLFFLGVAAIFYGISSMGLGNIRNAFFRLFGVGR